MNKLSLLQVEQFTTEESGDGEPSFRRIIQLAEQLADTMRENESLRVLLEESGERLKARGHNFGYERIQEALNCNKESAAHISPEEKAAITTFGYDSSVHLSAQLARQMADAERIWAMRKAG